MKQKIKFKQTEIGKIPKDWEETSIDNICEVSSSKRIFLADYVKSGIPFFRSKEIILKSNGKKISDPLFISKERFSEIDKKFGSPKGGDILLTSVGTLGIPYIVNKEEIFYFKDGNLTWFKNFKERVLSKFVFYWLKSTEGRNQIFSSAIGSTQQALTIQAIKNFKIKLPPLSEQTAIAFILSSLDEKIELNNKMNKTIEAIGQAIFKRWFVNFEFPNEKGKPYKSSGGEMVESELGEIPKGWKTSTIGKELKTILGGTPSRAKPEYWGGDINWINSGKVNEFRITESSEKITEEGLKKSATSLLLKGAVVLAITGATLGQVSRLEIDSCANQSVIGILEDDKLSSEYIYFWIKHNINDIIGFQTGGAQQHINKTNVNNYLLLIPNEKILKKLNELVKPIFEQISINCFQNQTLSQTRDTLLPKLMNGEMRVK